MVEVLAGAKAWIPVLAALGGGASVVAAFVWRYYQIRSQHEQILGSLTDLKAGLETLAGRQAKTARIVIALQTQIELRSQDSSKLEGKVEVLADTLAKNIGTLQAVSASLDGVWRTLQFLFPDKVPKRVSDGN